MKYRHIDDETVERLKQEYGDVLVVETKTRAFVFKPPDETTLPIIGRFVARINNDPLSASWELVSHLVVYPGKEEVAKVLRRKPFVIVRLAERLAVWLGMDELEDIDLNPFNKPSPSPASSSDVSRGHGMN